MLEIHVISSPVAQIPMLQLRKSTWKISWKILILSPDLRQSRLVKSPCHRISDSKEAIWFFDTKIFSQRSESRKRPRGVRSWSTGTSWDSHHQLATSSSVDAPGVKGASMDWCSKGKIFTGNSMFLFFFFACLFDWLVYTRENLHRKLFLFIVFCHEIWRGVPVNAN